jgi:hypothetical protein
LLFTVVGLALAYRKRRLDDADRLYPAPSPAR